MNFYFGTYIQVLSTYPAYLIYLIADRSVNRSALNLTVPAFDAQLEQERRFELGYLVEWSFKVVLMIIMK